MKLSPARLRILAMLDQQGPLHRHVIGEAFAKKGRMWPQAATRLAGFLCKPLVDGGMISESRDRQGFHRYFAITRSGKEAYRKAAP